MKISLENVLRKEKEAYATSSTKEEAFSVFWQWLHDNEKYFDQDASAFLDGLLKHMSEEAKANVDNMPDSHEKRTLMRKAAFIGETHHKAKDLLDSIQRPFLTEDKMSEVWMANMLQLHQSVLDLLFDVVNHSSKEKQPLVALTLCYSCVDELTAALHLAAHHYYVQASNHLRTVMESIERMDLFRQFPEMIAIWAGDDKKRIRKEFSPGEVRKKLGREKFDLLYSYLSEMGTHPTFDMFIARAARDAKDESKARIFVGGTPHEHLRLFYYSISQLVASALMGSVMRSFQQMLNREECVQLSKSRIEEMKSYVHNFFLPNFPKDNDKIKELMGVFDKFLSDLENDEGSQETGSSTLTE